MGFKNLPLGEGEKHVRAFERLGWTRNPSRGGSHVTLSKPNCRYTLSIPCHGGVDVKRALIAKLIKLADITEAEYVQAYKGKR